MLRLLLAALCTLSLTAGMARAEGAAACQSIVDRDCPPLARVTVKGNLRVEVFARRRTVSFPLAAVSADEREEFASSCVDGKCDCAEDVQYFEFKGPVPGFRQVNADEHAAGQKAKCSIENSNVVRQALRFSVTDRFVSTATYELEYCRTCGGSCHGRTVLMTHDGGTGRTLAIRDWLKPGALDALRKHMVNHVLKTYAAPSDSAHVRTQLAKELAARPLADEGFYVENGTLYVDIDSFVLGCADGSFYPVPVPRDLLIPSFGAAR